MNNRYNKGVTRLMLALCTVGMSLTACSSDEEMASDTMQTKAMNVAITTRAAEENPWSENDNIVLCAFSGGESQYASYTYGPTGQWTTTKSLNCQSDNQNFIFFGYYPATATSNGLAFEIPTDQSSEEKLHAADFMTTDKQWGVVSSKETAVDFAFSHRLAKIVVTVIYNPEFKVGYRPTLTSERFMSQGSGVGVTMNSQDGESCRIAATGNATPIQPLIRKEYGSVVSYTVLVAPTALSRENCMMMTFNLNGNAVQMDYPASLSALESGVTYTMELRLGRDSVELTQIKSNSYTFPVWGNESDEEDLVES